MDVTSSVEMTGEGMFISVICLSTGELMSLNTIFVKPKEKVPSNDANFFDSAGLAHSSRGKR